jgi:hypothetical protein
MAHDLRILFADPAVRKWGGKGQRWYSLAEMI